MNLYPLNEVLVTAERVIDRGAEAEKRIIRKDDIHYFASSGIGTLVGSVVTAHAHEGDIVLEYADGRVVTIELHACPSHQCDEHKLVVVTEVNA